jgi:hypothetical protein
MISQRLDANFSQWLNLKQDRIPRSITLEFMPRIEISEQRPSPLYEPLPLAEGKYEKSRVSK